MSSPPNTEKFVINHRSLLGYKEENDQEKQAASNWYCIVLI